MLRDMIISKMKTRIIVVTIVVLLIICPILSLIATLIIVFKTWAIFKY